MLEDGGLVAFYGVANPYLVLGAAVVLVGCAEPHDAVDESDGMERC